MRHAGALVLFSALVIIATSSPDGELETLDLGASTSTAVGRGRHGSVRRMMRGMRRNMFMSTGSFFPRGLVRGGNQGNHEEEELGEAASAKASSTPSADGPEQLGEEDQGPLSWMKVVAPKGLIQDAQKALCMGWKELGRCHEGFVRQQCTDVCEQQHTDPGAVARSVNCWTSSIHFSFLWELTYPYLQRQQVRNSPAWVCARKEEMPHRKGSTLPREAAPRDLRTDLVRTHALH